MAEDVCLLSVSEPEHVVLTSLLRHKKLYTEVAAASNISVMEHEATFDPEASWLKFHLGISRYALYPRDDRAVPKLLKDMQSMMIVSAGEALDAGDLGLE